MKISQITNYLETIAPLSYQESYDNAGLIVGDSSAEITGILCSLDCTEDVVNEAISKNCNLIVAHHPIVFSGLKKITGRNYVEKTIIKAIKNDIAIYAIHTNLDHVLNGVNAKICEKIGVKNPKILLPKRNLLKKLTTFVPPSHTQILLDSLALTGAGNIGNYSHCSFTLTGEGTFMPNNAANPVIGEANKLERLTEARIEVVFPAHLENQILATLRKNHPYEEVAYYVHLLENENQEIGAGMIGELQNEMSINSFLAHLKTAMDLQVIKYTKLNDDKMIKKVAVCGGAGSFLLKNAIATKADVFITSDYKYHEFFDAEHKIMIADIGHYESEKFTKELLVEFLVAKFANTTIIKSTVNTNPVAYFTNLIDK
jgi:dinuclear metal center YbgI/SA1388 family protein